MSRTKKQNARGRRGRQLAVRGVRRDTPDLRKLSRAVIEIALEQAAREAAAEAEAREEKPKDKDADERT